MESYLTKEACAERVRALISLNSGASDNKKLANAITYSVANSVSDNLAIKADGLHAGALELKAGTWALRDEDLDMFPVIGAVVALVAALSAPAGGFLAAGGVLAVTTVQILWKFHQDGVRLTVDQAKTLTVLRSDQQPKDPTSLAAKLGHEWTEEKVKTLLGQLQAMPARVGLRKLAEEMPDGRWVAAA